MAKVAVAPKRGPEPKQFGQVTAWICLALIALVALIQWSRLATRKRPRRLVAATRYIAYTRVPLIDMGLSHFIVLVSLFISLFVYLLSAEQWYRAGKWSPLGLRAGYIAAGLSPFIFSFGSRINPFVWIARLSHDRWMVYHQWGARVIFLFSMIHTGTMIKSKWGTMGELWKEEGVTSQFFTKDARLANGTVAIVLMAWIMFSSFANFRRMSYEFFVIQHVVTVCGLLISLVAHLQVDLKQGINYFYASAAVWAFSLLVRLGFNVLSAIGVGRFKGRATLTPLPDGLTRLDIQTTGKASWMAGQHVYCRMTRLNPFQSHPFTIASVSNADDTHHTLSLLIRTRNGLTGQIAKRAAESPSSKVPIIIEGPYGSLEEKLTGFDHVLLIAGGVGATFACPLAEYLGTRGVPYRMVWTVRSPEALTWFDLSRLDQSRLQLHVTGGRSFDEKSGMGNDDSPETPELEKVSSDPPNKWLPGRPDAYQIVKDAVKEVGPKSRVAVLVCGPTELLEETTRGVRDIQRDIARGASEIGELWLHREAFSW